jgi:hypothetical protein
MVIGGTDNLIVHISGIYTVGYVTEATQIVKNSLESKWTWRDQARKISD